MNGVFQPWCWNFNVKIMLIFTTMKLIEIHLLWKAFMGHWVTIREQIWLTIVYMSITKLIGTVMGSFSPTKSAIPDKLIEKNKKVQKFNFQNTTHQGLHTKHYFLHPQDIFMSLFRLMMTLTWVIYLIYQLWRFSFAFNDKNKTQSSLGRSFSA